MIPPDKLDTAIILKFFDKEEYARRFIDGELFVSKLQRFKDIESKGRKDTEEGTVTITNNDNNIRLFISDKENFSNTDELHGLTSLRLNASRYNNNPIWCAALLYEGNGLIRKDNRIEFDSDIMRMAEEFGNYVVLMYFTKFIKLMSETFKNRLVAQEVNYVDNEEKMHQMWKYFDNQGYIVFTKNKEYSYQHEYRVLFIKESIDKDSTIYKGPKMSLANKECTLVYADTLIKNGITVIDDINKASILR